jgi:O-antigen/teichoic acid export membrane protein
MGLFGDTVVPLLKGFGQPGKIAILEVVQSLLVILSVWWLAKSYGLVGAALATLGAVTASQGISVMFTQQILEHPFRGLGRRMFFIITAAGAGALAALGIDTFVSGILGLILAGLAGGMVTGMLLWAADRRYNLALFQDLARAFPQIAPLAGAASAKAADAV